MSAGNRPFPGISAIPGINKIPGFDGQPFGMPQGRPFGGLGGVVSALAGQPQPQMPQSSAPGAIPAGMQMANGALQPKPQQPAQPFGGVWGQNPSWGSQAPAAGPQVGITGLTGVTQSPQQMTRRPWGQNPSWGFGGF